MNETMVRNNKTYLNANDIPKFDAEMVRKSNVDFFFHEGKTYVDGVAYVEAVRAGRLEIEAEVRQLAEVYKQIKDRLRKNHPARYVAFLICLPFFNACMWAKRKLEM